MKSSGPRLFFVKGRIIINSISLITVKLFRFSVSSCVSFDSLFSVLELPFGSFFIASFSLQRFPNSSFHTAIFSYLNIFITAPLKFLPGNHNVWLSWGWFLSIIFVLIMSHAFQFLCINNNSKFCTGYFG